mmetsp:Transcript_16760/g.39800  ORF Transcript_16760/g.39800 Transcript_16760/m.39800 type:complete len:304 (-) Transcript_16760:291-1202(-)
MSWDFDELDQLEQSHCHVGTVSPKLASQVPVDQTSFAKQADITLVLKPSATEAFKTSSGKSRRRIASVASQGWQQILDVDEADEKSIKKAYYHLARLHHPDKSGMEADAEIFRIVQQAYEDGIQASQRRTIVNMSSDGACAGSTQSKRCWPLSVAAPWSKELLRSAVDEWEHDYDEGNVNSVPDAIPEVSSSELSVWLQRGTCVPIDCREPLEAKYETRTPLVPGAQRMSFSELRSMPESLIHRIRGVLQVADSTGEVVTFSTHGGTSGNCGMCASLLIDVFGLNPSHVWRLEGGLDEWILGA